MAASAKSDPKTRILDAAERRFAEAGFAGASLRDIVKEAKVNLATVYYYFQSKQNLMAAVIDRRFAPMRTEHLELLQRCVADARGKKVKLDAILEALITPPLRLASTSSGSDKTVARLLGRVVTEPNPEFHELLRSQTAQVRNAFFEVFQRTLSNLSPADIHWRIEFFWGALAFILCNPDKIERMSHGACDPSDSRAVMAQLKRFFVAGFNAPPA